jgi:hypothetical protein
MRGLFIRFRKLGAVTAFVMLVIVAGFVVWAGIPGEHCMPMGGRPLFPTAGTDPAGDVEYLCTRDWGETLRPLPPVVTAMMITLSAVLAARHYKRSSTTPGHVSVLADVAADGREYCLLLRPFGRDGGTILPKHRNGSRDIYRNTTLEQVVTDTARRVLGVETVAVVDQRTFLVPPGPTYFRAPDDTWQDVVRRLIEGARVIVLLLPIRQEVRSGFDWEVEQIARLGAHARLVLLLPPFDQNRFARPAVVGQAAVVMANLLPSTTPGGRSRSIDDQRAWLAPHTVAVSWDGAAAATQWEAVDPPGRRWLGRLRSEVGDETYADILTRIWEAGAGDLGDAP